MVHKKLMAARIMLQNAPLKKSGHNKFAGYRYFELADFLPTVNSIFNEVGLSHTLEFTDTLATMSVIDFEKGGIAKFTCPMAEAHLKGCHPVQNLGASITYITRYLLVMALAICEHDALDATTGSKVVEEEGTPDEGRMLDYIAAIEATTTVDELKNIYIEAFAATDGNKAWQTKMIAAKDAKKKVLK